MKPVTTAVATIRTTSAMNRRPGRRRRFFTR
jgi:hypothetical protein